MRCCWSCISFFSHKFFAATIEHIISFSDNRHCFH